MQLVSRTPYAGSVSFRGNTNVATIACVAKRHVQGMDGLRNLASSPAFARNRMIVTRPVMIESQVGLMLLNTLLAASQSRALLVNGMEMMLLKGS